MKTTVILLSFAISLCGVAHGAESARVPGPWTGGALASASNAIFRHHYQVIVPRAGVTHAEATDMVKGTWVGKIRNVRSYGSGSTAFEFTSRGLTARRLVEALKKREPGATVHSTFWD